jgi:hypothetical protein
MPVLSGLVVKNLCCATTRIVEERNVTFAVYAIISAKVSLKKNAGNWTNHPMYVMDVTI